MTPRSAHTRLADERMTLQPCSIHGTTYRDDCDECETAMYAWYAAEQERQTREAVQYVWRPAGRCWAVVTVEAGR